MTRRSVRGSDVAGTSSCAPTSSGSSRSHHRVVCSAHRSARRHFFELAWLIISPVRAQHDRAQAGIASILRSNLVNTRFQNLQISDGEASAARLAARTDRSGTIAAPSGSLLHRPRPSRPRARLQATRRPKGSAVSSERLRAGQTAQASRPVDLPVGRRLRAGSQSARPYRFGTRQMACSNPDARRVPRSARPIPHPPVPPPR